ncbi:Fe-S cluster assembly protein IscX [Candidatus Poribacteria bacterium]|nr:Fe-S cluster assembly protein IscX [Candidatus Poribacteria bacterium]
MAKLTWEDHEDIALDLIDAHPDIDVLSISFPTLHRWICQLERFDDDPEASNERTLEAIQMIWYEEVKDTMPTDGRGVER